MTILLTLLDRTGQFVAVHHGHHHVRNNQVEFLLADDVECFPSVGGYKHMVVLFQQTPHEHQQLLVIFDEQQFVSLLVSLLVQF